MRILIAGLIVGLILLCAWAGRLGVLGLSLAIGGTGAFELYGSLRSPSAAFRVLVCSVYLLLGIAMLCFAIVLPPASIAYIYLAVAVFDLSRRFLPAYGTITGLITALAFAVLARNFANLSVAGALAAWLWIAAAALAAEMTAAWIKRKSGIDRFGRWLPQGGVLDRFDGLLFAAPVALVILGR
ncbi:MAG: phosphatidate cytidylyltransferase [Bryobacterales bacterium]|nr:phosphatidate cytidylyltransferase [Bryobacterales bacterium]MBV9396636.1 phosphatidate cytidylyltransferase [Bryobacterales bacterium]